MRDYRTTSEHDAGRHARADAYDDGPDPSDAADYDPTTEAAMARCAREDGWCPECGEGRGRCLECFETHCLTLTCMPRECRDEEMRAALDDDIRKGAWG